MRETQWEAFVEARERYRAATAELAASLPELGKVQQALVDGRDAAAFSIDTPVVYNRALDDFRPADEIKLILVADNPGRREQSAENRRYLVGPSGKLAEGFFRAWPELGIDFRKQVLILNKTPIHTPRTAELKDLAKLGGERVATAIGASQRTMAELILAFHRALAPVPLWIIGYSELSRGKIFHPFAAALGELYAPEESLGKSVFLFRHFSMNQFSVDLRKRALEGEMLAETLIRVGSGYRRGMLGW